MQSFLRCGRIWVLIAIVGLIVASVARIGEPQGNPIPEVSTLLFVSSRDGNQDIYSMNVDGTGVTNLTQHPASYSLSDSPWSPDGNKIAFISDRDTGRGEIYIMNADGSDQRRITFTDYHESSPVWSPDGQKLAFSAGSPSPGGGSRVGTVNADGSGWVLIGPSRSQSPHWSFLDKIAFEIPITSSSIIIGWKIGVMNPDGTGITIVDSTPSNSLDDIIKPSWSPDGKKLAFVRNDCEDSDSDCPEIYVVDLDGSGMTKILGFPVAFPEQSIGELAWSPDGQKLAFSLDNTIYVVNIDGMGLQPLSTPGSNSSQIAWSPSGTQLAFVQNMGGNTDIFLINVAGAGLQNLTNNPNSRESALSWRPATSLPPPSQPALSFTSNRDGNYEIYTINTDGTGLTNLTQSPAGDFAFWANPWSPDGSKLAFVSDRDGELRVYVMNADGTGQRRVANVRGGQPAWSPDGNKFVFTVFGGINRIATINIDGSNQFTIPVSGAQDPEWSSLNKIAFHISQPPLPGNLVISNPDGTGQVVIGPGGNPAWAPDGQRLAFLGGPGDIYIVNHDGSNLRDIFSSSGGFTFAPALAWSPDGQQIAFAKSGGLYIINADGTGLQSITPETSGSVVDLNPNWSLDGTRLAFHRWELSPNVADIFIINIDGTGLQNLTNSPTVDDRAPYWKPTLLPPPPSHPTLSVTPSSLDFGNVPIESSKNRDFTIKNTGSGTLTGTVSVGTPFSIVAGGSFNLTAGQSRAVTVRFRPPSPDAFMSNVTFTSNGGDASPGVQGKGMVCTYTLSASSQTFDANGGKGNFNVITPNGCSWKTATSNPWITITSGKSGTGNGKVNFSVAPNPDVNPRSGVITIPDNAFTVSQAGNLNPRVSISPNSGPAGTLFAVQGQNFIPGGVIESHLKKPDKKEFAVLQFTADTEGRYSHTIVSTFFPSGSYTLWLIDKATGRRSNTSTFTINKPAPPTAAPHITLQSTSGPVNGFLTILGSNFGAKRSIVKLGRKKMKDVAWDDTRIVVIIPEVAAGTYPVTVTTSQGVSNSEFYTVLAPEIAHIKPEQGAAGITVGIAGDNLGPLQGKSSVYFGTKKANVLSWNDSDVLAVAPRGLNDQVPVTVKTAAGTSNNAQTFTYKEKPPEISKCQQWLSRPSECGLVAQLREERYLNIPPEKVSDNQLLAYVQQHSAAIEVLLAQIDYGRDIQQSLSPNPPRSLDNDQGENRLLKSLQEAHDTFETILGEVIRVLPLINPAFSVLANSYSVLSTVRKGVKVYKKLADLYFETHAFEYLWNYIGARKQNISKEEAWQFLREIAYFLPSIAENRGVTVDQLADWYENAFVAYRLVAYEDSARIRYAQGQAIAELASQVP